MTILLTGAAGFIGMHVAEKLLGRGHAVSGIDNLNDYYDVNLKLARLDVLQKWRNFSFYKADLSNFAELASVFDVTKPTIVVNLAAQAGVRYSLENPRAYCESNLVGFSNILEMSRKFSVGHLVYASSSSIYGLNREMPFSEDHKTDKPASLYGATKKANELMAHSYSHLFGLPTTGLRFFTVYGPWGRPDMAPMIFAKAILAEEPIKVFNGGKMKRDFTYIGDIVEGVVRVIEKQELELRNSAETIYSQEVISNPARVFNIGKGKPDSLMSFISTLERALGKEASKVYLEMQPGDVVETFANTQQLADWIDFRPSINLEEGVQDFANWFKNYFKDQTIKN